MSIYSCCLTAFLFLYLIVLSCLLLIVYPSFVLVSLIRHIPFFSFTTFISRTAVLSTFGVWLVLFLFTSVSFIIIGGFVLLAIEVCTLIKQQKKRNFLFISNKTSFLYDCYMFVSVYIGGEKLTYVENICITLDCLIEYRIKVVVRIVKT
jgi:hypothetical protein